MTHVEIVDSITLTATEKQEAEWTQNAVDSLLSQINSSESILRRDFAQLGTLLLRVRTKKYWHALGYPTFGSYIDKIKDKVGKGRTQLYQVVGVAEKLLPWMSPDDLAKIGISKAIELKKYIDQTGKLPPDDVVTAAENAEVGTAELKAILFQDKNPQTEQGTYFDLGGFYATKDERDEINRAFDVAAKTDPVVSNEIPEWARRKEIIQRLCMNYLAEYEVLVAKGQA